MALLLSFIMGLVAKVTQNLAGEIQSNQGTQAITQIIGNLPGDLGAIIVNFVKGLTGIVAAIGGLF
jgi:hypothetical protein